MGNILIVAGKEYRDGWRNRWVLAITAVFALFAFAIAYFGAAASGQVGFTSLATTIVSLASLAVFLIPLIALLLGYDTIVGEENQGTLLLLLSYPISRWQLLTGKLCGQGAILASATFIGFGAAGVAIASFTGQAQATEIWRAFGVFVGSAILLGWVFLALAYLISVMATDKGRAAGVALITWFFFVLIFDLGMLGILVMTSGQDGGDLLAYLLLLNPTDIFRLINLAGFESTRAYVGLLAVADDQLLSPLTLTFALAAWVVVPFSIAVWLFARRKH
ncbi:MAG: ABC transporter permease [Gammaproteobacteria bacterium]|nr:ABC transporter permease [Gammaproteobacteria bacterium]